MKKFECTLGRLDCDNGNQFCSTTGGTITLRAKSARNAAAAALRTRAKLASSADHDVEGVYAIDRDFGTDGRGSSHVRAVCVQEVW
jgi:hypothetical protein